MKISPRPSRAELLAAEGKTIPDVIAPGLKVVFCGINPGLYSAAAGHHFARPGNRFWKTLFNAGFTPRLFSAYEDSRLIEWELGSRILLHAQPGRTYTELVSGRKTLEGKIKRNRPQFLAVLGIGAYRNAFGDPRAEVGQQPITIGTTVVWVLPNPSGLNANYQVPDLVPLFSELLDRIRKRG